MQMGVEDLNVLGQGIKHQADLGLTLRQLEQLYVPIPCKSLHTQQACLTFISPLQWHAQLSEAQQSIAACAADQPAGPAACCRPPCSA